MNAQLTQREREILNLVASGEKRYAIALRLRISARTVDFHLSNAFVRLGVKSSAAAVAKFNFTQAPHKWGRR